MKFYLYVSMIGCVLDFIRSYRTSKYRKHIDNQLEMIRTTINIFLPLYNVLMLISNLIMMFRSEEYCKLIAMIEDKEMLREE